ncbi:HipA N-terminal domain-containing protein [bacterium]
MKKNRRAFIFVNNEEAGVLEETNFGYRFIYTDEYISKGIPISMSMALTTKVYESKKLFSFFKGLLPEGWYLDIVSQTLKIDRNDEFGILLATCKDTIGAVRIEEIK